MCLNDPVKQSMMCVRRLVGGECYVLIVNIHICSIA